MKKHLPADADRTVWIVTAASVALVLVLLTAAGLIPSRFLVADIVLYALSALAAAVVALGLLVRPLRYEVRDDSLTIIRYRPLAPVTILKSEIKEVKHVRLGTIKPASLAIYGLFGYVGRFDTTEQGSVTMIGTNPEHAVLIDARERLVITPSNPKRFMHDLSGKK